MACVGPEVGDCMNGGTDYVEDGDLRDGNASSCLLAVFTVPVRLAAARGYCEMVLAGDGGSDVGCRQSTLPVRHRGACGGLLRIVGQRSPIPRKGWSGR